MVDAPEPRKMRFIPFSPTPSDREVAKQAADQRVTADVMISSDSSRTSATAAAPQMPSNSVPQTDLPEEASDNPEATEGYKVGYGKPPKENRFPNKFSNTKGRPKGSVSLKTVLRQLINKRIAVTENGKRVKRSYLEVLISKTGSDALTKQGKATDQMLRLIERLLSDEVAAIDHRQTAAEDKLLFAEFKAAFAKGARS